MKLCSFWQYTTFRVLIQTRSRNSPKRLCCKTITAEPRILANLTPQILKFAPNEVKECRNRSENLINRKRTNFCIEATPPKNSHRKKNSRKKSIRKKIFLKSIISEIYFEIYEKLRIFQILKINFQIYRKFQKKLPLKKNLTFSKI